MEEKAKIAKLRQARTTLKYRLGMAGFLFFERCLALLPMKFLCGFGRCLGYAAYLALPSRRHIVARNLRIVMNPAMRGSELKANVKENFKRMGANLIGAAKLSILKDEKLLHYVTIEHGDVFEAASHKDTGCICCVAHSGNWEVLARLRSFFPGIANYGSMYRQMDNPLLEDYLYKRRTGAGTQMFSKENGINRPFQFLEDNGYLGVLSDQFTQEGVFVPYFRKVTGTTYLPALLYKRTKTDMISVCVRTRRVGHWISNMGVSLDPLRIGKSLAEITIAVNQSLEKNLLESPLDGFWMHHRWKATAQFAPRDPKTNKILKTMDLMPFRIIVVAPELLRDAVSSVPLVRALRDARCDIEVIVACKEDQLSFWKTVEATSSLISYADEKDLREQLGTPELYDKGPYDMAILLDEDKKTIKAFAPYDPVSFAGFATHPLAKKARFRVKATEPEDGSIRHRIDDFMAIAKKFKLETESESFYPTADNEENRAGVIIAWDGNEELLDQLKSLPQDVASKLRIFCPIGVNNRKEGLPFSVTAVETDALIAEMSKAKTVIADGSTMASLASYAGARCLAVMNDDEFQKYRPWDDDHGVATTQEITSLLQDQAQ